MNPSKRARYDETGADERNKSGRWALNSKNDLELDEIFDRGVGRLDCEVDDIFTDDDTIFNKNEPGAIDVSCVSMTPNTRDKQVFRYVTDTA